MIRNSFLFFSVLLLTISASGAVTAYKHYNAGLGVWDQTLTTSWLWADIAEDSGSIVHLPGGKGNFPSGSSAFRGCVEFNPPTVIYHHDYDGVIWNDDEGTIECWISPRWNGENQGGNHQNDTYNDVIIGDGVNEWQSGAQGFNLFFFDNNVGATPGYQMFVVFVDNDGVNVFEHYEVGNTMDWTAGSWHHVCISWDATEVLAGLDGKIFGKKTRNGGFNFAKGGYLLGMYTANGPINSWDGWADDFAVYDTALYTGVGDVNDTFSTPTAPAVPVNDKQAWLPTPAKGADVSKVEGSTLSWKPGTDVVTHLVYWSDSLAEVADRIVTPVNLTHTADGNSTATPGTPQLGTTYYWAVDEVDSTATTHAGNLWSYTIFYWIIVDDMENYDGSAGSGNDVSDTWTSTAGANIHAVDDGYDGTKQAMEFIYDNNGPGPYYSEIVVDTSLLECGSDWISDGTRWLQVNFKGDPNNDPNERMYLAIEDGNNPEPNFAMVQHGLPDSYSNPKWPEDMNDIRLTTWDAYGWAINLKSFTGVNLTDVRKVYIGFGERGKVNDGSHSGAPLGQYQGIVIFDELRLLRPGFDPWPWPPPKGDLNWDMEVNFEDLAIMSYQWLIEEEPEPMWPDW